MLDSTMFKFIEDSVKNLQTDPRGSRWSDSTKRLLAALHIQGGKRSARLLGNNVAGPCDTTIHNMLVQSGSTFLPGIVRANFVRIAAVIRDLMVKRKITGRIPFEMSEDETPVQKVHLSA